MNKNLVIIGFVWPEPKSTAAGIRMLQLIKLFQEKDYSITFCCTASKTENSFQLDALEIQTIAIELNDPTFDEVIKKIDPVIVLFDRFLTEEQFGWRIAEICPNCIRILDTEDLHFLRKARQQGLIKNEKLSLEILTNDITKREIASIYRCDISLIISKFEYELLADTFKIDASLLFYMPFIFDELKFSDLQALPDFEAREHFMTIGNFKHEPNWNAVLYLKQIIWPILRGRIPTAKLFVYGAYATEKVKQLHNEKEGFYIKGWVENAEEAFKIARVCLAPLQFGAGLKGKLIDAMLYGTPSVTTKIGAEAMHDNLPWNGFIADEAHEFSQKATELYLQKELWMEAQKNGVRIINHCYSKEKFELLFFDKINTTKENLKNHRLQNFMGAMLLHHTLQSTKYLSKWIEEKNKKNNLPN